LSIRARVEGEGGKKKEDGLENHPPLPFPRPFLKCFFSGGGKKNKKKKVKKERNLRAPNSLLMCHKGLKLANREWPKEKKKKKREKKKTNGEDQSLFLKLGSRGV